MTMMNKFGILNFKYLYSVKFNKISGMRRNIRHISVTSKAMGVHATLKVKDDIGIVQLNSPGKLNVLNLEVLKDMNEIINKIDSSPSIRAAVIVSNKPSCFVAGADINLFSSCKTPQDAEQLSKTGQNILNRLENSKKPFVAGIMGSCLGGGLEVALSCHYRIAVQNKATFGLPEVQLGLLPGLGGTQRLPQLIGLPNSLDMMLTGKNVPAYKAKSMGMVDLLISPTGPGLNYPENRTLEYLEDIAVATARNLVNGHLKVYRQPKGLYDMLVNYLFQTNFVRNYIFKQAKEKVMNQTKGLYPAPLKIIHVVSEGLNKGKAVGYKEEAKVFGELVMTKESQGLRSLFHGQTQCKINKFGKPKNEIKTIGILGAGLMGAGIADISIRNGYRTILKDISLNSLSKGEAQIQKAINKSIKKKRITNLEGEKYISQLVPTIDYGKFSKADIVIEAVTEELSLKQKIVQEIEEHIPKDCIVATNTSAIRVSDIAKASKRPQNVIGMHYFAPVDKMQLLEVVVTEKTSKEAIKVVVDIGLKQGKIPIVVKDGPGFYTSRILSPILTESYRIMTEGVLPTEVDRICLAMGFPLGGATLGDEIGLDTTIHVYFYFLKEFGERVESNNPKMAAEIIDSGFLGRKTGKGAYVYDAKTGQKTLHKEAVELLAKYKTEPKIPLTDESMQFRIISRIINEATYCLQEGVISNPLEGDIAAVFGLGFPPLSGGPFHYVDSFGADKFVAKMKEYEQQYGATFTPSQLLLDHAKDPTKKFFK